MPRPATGLNTVSRKRPDGAIEHVWYHRRTGLLIGRSRDGWTKDAAIERARELDEPGTAGPARGTFGELCTLYLASPAFRNRAPKTQKGYRANIETLRGMWGAVPVQGITRKAVAALHATYEDRPWQGNAMMRTLRLLFNFGLHQVEMPGLLKNPAQRVEHFVTRPRTQVWDQPRIDAFLDHAPPSLRTAFALLLYTVQRPADMLTMARPMMWEEGSRTWIRLRQGKTEELVDVPCHARLLAELGPAPVTAAEKLAEPPRLVTSPRGLEWSYRNFARAWDRTRHRANHAIARAAIAAMGGLPRAPVARAAAKAQVRARLLLDLQRRDLRRTGVVQLALAGATVPQIAALAGWRIDHAQHIVDTYLPRRSEIARGGVEKWEADQVRVVSLGSKRR